MWKIKKSKTITKQNQISL